MMCVCVCAMLASYMVCDVGWWVRDLVCDFGGRECVTLAREISAEKSGFRLVSYTDCELCQWVLNVPHAE